MLRTVKYGLCGAVLAGVVGGMVAWTNVDKTVTLVVDGRTRTVHTMAGSVGAVLREAGYHVDGHDLLAPAASSEIHDGGRIVLKRGRLLRLDVDGRSRFVWTTAPTVSVALAQLGFSTDDFTSVSRSRRLPLSPTDISVRTPKTVTISHDGGRQTVDTTDLTVAGLLSDLGITLGPNDRMNASSSSQLTDGEHIKITRVDRQRYATTHRIPFATHHVDDASMPAGKTKLVRTGRDGMRRTVWAVVYIDGRLAGRTKISSEIVRHARPALRKIGTKEVATSSGGSGGGSGGSGGAPSAPAPSPGTAKAIARQMLADRGWGDQSQYDCLVTLWNNESGWRVHAQNPSGAYGIPQALPGSKMASAGPDWQNNAHTQIAWGLSYIASRYGTPCGAWSYWQGNGWY